LTEVVRVSAHRLAFADCDHRNPAKPGNIVNIARAVKKRSRALHALEASLFPTDHTANHGKIRARVVRVDRRSL
jgi:hypothetical protein